LESYLLRYFNATYHLIIVLATPRGFRFRQLGVQNVGTCSIQFPPFLTKKSLQFYYKQYLKVTDNVAIIFSITRGVNRKSASSTTVHLIAGNYIFNGKVTFSVW
jgi:hypothetical protein